MKLIKPVVHRDDRGFFVETYHQRRYAEAGIPSIFVQDNHSRSVRGTLRGLHMQCTSLQAKLVRVILGEIFDVAVDVRVGSPTFGRWTGATLSDANGDQLYVPEGFAHGLPSCRRWRKSNTSAAPTTTPPTKSPSASTTPRLAWPGR